jgi:tRNA dimethylallyltransferase
MYKKRILLIIGPTATGKTALSLKLAQHFNIPILNADSLLFYKELNIGVAKPSKEELSLAPHYLIDIASITKPLNAMDFRSLALKCLSEIWENDPLTPVILCGGSGFYLKALLYGMYESKTPSTEILKQSQELYEKEGIAPFIRILEIQDSNTMRRLHPNDHYRIRRAVEHWWTTGTTLSSAHLKQDEKNKLHPFWMEQGWELLPLYTDVPKIHHQKLIEARTQVMIDQGLINEVENLLTQFCGKEKPLQSIGYKEVQDFLQGRISSIDSLKEEIIISTRQLAKSQRTWFAGMEKVCLDYPIRWEEVVMLVEKFLKP